MSDASALLGTWRIVAWTRTAVASGVTADAIGPDPNGYIAYHADGRLALVVGREGRKSRSPPTTVEAALFDTMLAYAASYEFEDGKVIHHVDAAWRPEWGPHLIRPFKLEGRQPRHQRGARQGSGTTAAHDV